MLEARTAALCSRVGLPPPQTGKDGRLALRFAGGLTVELAQRGPDILIRGTVCALPDDPAGRDRLCRRLLTLALGRTLKEGGACLPALCEEEGAVRLAAAFPGESPDVFEEQVEAFLNFLETWRKLAVEQDRPAPSSFMAMLGGLRP